MLKRDHTGSDRSAEKSGQATSIGSIRTKLGVLRQFPPHSDNSVQYGHQHINRAVYEASQRKRLLSMLPNREHPVLQHEHRLDRLGLSMTSMRAGVHSPGYKDTPNSATLTRLQDHREIDIER